MTDAARTTPVESDEEYRAALWRAQARSRVQFNAYLWRALAGDPAAAAEVHANWQPLIAWRDEVEHPTDPATDPGQDPVLSDMTNV